MNAIAVLNAFVFPQPDPTHFNAKSRSASKSVVYTSKKVSEEHKTKSKHKLSKCDANQTPLADKAVTGLINLPPPPVKELLQASQTRPVSLGGQYVETSMSRCCT